MAKQKNKHPVFVSPSALFGYAWVNKPDDKFGDPKYKMTLKFPKDGLTEKVTWMEGAEEKAGTVKDFVNRIQKIHKTAAGGLEGCPVKDGDVPNKKGKTPNEGFITLEAKSKYKPESVDAKRNPLPASVYPMSGDVGRIVFSIYEFDDGISLRLMAVQLLEKNNGGGGNAAGMFGEVDGGYEASDAEDVAEHDVAPDDDGFCDF